MSTGKVVLGALTGLAVGAIAGVLFAPAKGSKTRKRIKRRGNDYVDDVKSKFADVKDSISEKFQSTKRDAESFLDNGKESYDDAKKDVKNAVAKFKHDGAADKKHVNV